jgi:hypothetical protein
VSAHEPPGSLPDIVLMQWFKSYFDLQTGGQGLEDYDAPARRALCKTGDIKGQKGTSANTSRRATDNGTSPATTSRTAPPVAKSASNRPSSKLISASSTHSDKHEEYEQQARYSTHPLSPPTNILMHSCRRSQS